jgi:hypothetical protein
LTTPSRTRCARCFQGIRARRERPFSVRSVATWQDGAI